MPCIRVQKPHTRTRTNVLFLKATIVFSSLFSESVTSLYQRYKFYPHVDFKHFIRVNWWHYAYSTCCFRFVNYRPKEDMSCFYCLNSLPVRQDVVVVWLHCYHTSFVGDWHTKTRKTWLSLRNDYMELLLAVKIIETCRSKIDTTPRQLLYATSYKCGITKSQ